jgi:hypothetical protein
LVSSRDVGYADDVAIPFLGLTVATAPGFAHYLTFLRPLRDSDGLWTGVVEALVPAFLLSHLLMAAVLATHRMSSRLIELIIRNVSTDTLYLTKSTKGTCL